MRVEIPPGQRTPYQSPRCGRAHWLRGAVWVALIGPRREQAVQSARARGVAAYQRHARRGGESTNGSATVLSGRWTRPSSRLELRGAGGHWAAARREVTLKPSAPKRTSRLLAWPSRVEQPSRGSTHRRYSGIAFGGQPQVLALARLGNRLRFVQRLPVRRSWMDDAVQRFRRQASRELEDRQGTGRRYSGRAAAASGGVLASAGVGGRRGSGGGHRARPSHW